MATGIAEDGNCDCDPLKTVKCMIVGDSETGKTILFRRMLNVPEESENYEYTPTVFDIVNTEVRIKEAKTPLTVALWDTAGSHVYDTIRPISYAHTDCFIICYRKDDPKSLENVGAFWYPEIVTHGDGPTVPVILVETHQSNNANDEKCRLQCESIQEKINSKEFFQFCINDKDKLCFGAILDKAVELAYAKKVDEGKPPNPIWKFYSMTVIIAGDCKVGKSSLIEKCIIQKSQNDESTSSPSTKSPTVHTKTQRYQEYYHDLVMDGCEYFLRLLEVQLDSESGSCTEIIQLSKQVDADVLLLCYAINDPFSFQSVDNFSRTYLNCKSDLQVPIILIATKSDLKEVSDIIIPPEDGEALMFQMKCKAFVECSSKTKEISQNLSLPHLLINACNEGKSGEEIKE